MGSREVERAVQEGSGLYVIDLLPVEGLELIPFCEDKDAVRVLGRLKGPRAAKSGSRDSRGPFCDPTHTPPSPSDRLTPQVGTQDTPLPSHPSSGTALEHSYLPCRGQCGL